MERDKFIAAIETIMFEEGWQTKKGRTIKQSLKNQRQAINILAVGLGIKRLTLDQVEELSFG